MDEAKVNTSEHIIHVIRCASHTIQLFVHDAFSLTLSHCFLPSSNNFISHACQTYVFMHSCNTNNCFLFFYLNFWFEKKTNFIRKKNLDCLSILQHSKNQLNCKKRKCLSLEYPLMNLKYGLQYKFNYNAVSSHVPHIVKTIFILNMIL